MGCLDGLLNLNDLIPFMAFEIPHVEWINLYTWNVCNLYFFILRKPRDDDRSKLGGKVSNSLLGSFENVGFLCRDAMQLERAIQIL